VSPEIIFVNRFGKIIFVLAFFAAIFAVNLDAQPASTAAAGDQMASASSAAAAPAKAAPTEELVPAASPAVFYIGQPPASDKDIPSILTQQIPEKFALPITNSMICTWIVAAFILIVVRIGTWNNIKEIPSGLQNVIEALVEGWDGLIGDILDKRVTRWVFPFATTFFIFIVISNLTDLVPGVGSIGATHNGEFRPFFRPPTTDANLTCAMAGIFLVMSLYWAVRYNGFWGLIKHIFGVKMETSKLAYPLFFLLFLFIGAMELLSVMFARPVALAMRLYGNVFAGESILDMIFHGKSLVFSLILSSGMYFYETFVCLVQAFVFAMLVVAFVGTLCSHTDEEHGH
jgi:F-type H+-transporting ATPase subunit a